MKKIPQIVFYLVLVFSVKAQRDTLVKADRDTIFDACDRLVNKKVPVYTAVTIDGKKIDSAYFNNKVTVLTFFGFNCWPCLYELDILDEIVKEYPKDKYQVLLIGDGSDKDLRDLRAYHSKHYRKLKRKMGIDTLAFDMVADCPENPVKLFGKSCPGSTPVFKVVGFPTTFFINREGIIKEICHGFAVPRNKESDEYFLSKLHATGE